MTRSCSNVSTRRHCKGFGLKKKYTSYSRVYAESWERSISKIQTSSSPYRRDRTSFCERIMQISKDKGRDREHENKNDRKQSSSFITMEVGSFFNLQIINVRLARSKKKFSSQPHVPIVQHTQFGKFAWGWYAAENSVDMLGFKTTIIITNGYFWVLRSVTKTWELDKRSGSVVNLCRKQARQNEPVSLGAIRTTSFTMP